MSRAFVNAPLAADLVLDGLQPARTMRGDQVGGAIHWRIHVSVSPDRVFGALDSDDGRASFWAESAVEADGYIHFRFINGVELRSRLLERRAGSVFELEYFGSAARFDLKPDGVGGTDILLTHDRVRDEDWQEVHAGWLNVLFPLKAWLVHGVDLRNHDPARLWEDGYADQ